MYMYTIRFAAPFPLDVPPHSFAKIEKVRRHATALLGRSMPRYDCGAIAATKIANLLYNIPPPSTLPYFFPISLRLLNSQFFPSVLWGRLTHFF